MKWYITPLVGANNIKFGMTREEVRKLVNLPYTEFYKWKSTVPTDAYKYFHAFYDEEDKLEALEFSDEVELIYKEINMFSLAQEGIQSLFEEIEVDGEYLTDIAYSIGIFIPEDEQNPESILIGKKDYYV
ncbi:hypothetical protein AN639_03245 [Candidatus Epulonipiscium fishelsonii]|uniref:Uncharacterized protein n=1 Tax=Candidatus Epulonipiscium fishelsonii TaxID=77094 RepID=A0ACC8XGS3_9FIRM|nr:hypothetical protein AN639_03245 [Epulopiscium sp. SCG-B05WGA-EpuloA1]ONI42632.1 hypothetical protein AN396_13700 [Epulopiscium sp. SCG-B11WGA-EpuloA1]